jgi:hypothetical protein
MTGVSGGGRKGLTPEERETVEYISNRYRNGLNLSLIENLIADGQQRQTYALDEWESSESVEHRVAAQILTFRENTSLYDRLVWYQIEIVTKGSRLLREEQTYWRFEPCIECIFEMEPEQIERAYQYLCAFEESDYDVAAEQVRHQFADRQTSLPDTTDPRFPTALLDTIEVAFPIVERGFPNLLALKRILDEEDPTVEVLQRKSLSSVVRELSDTESELNSAYFDLIVSTYPSTLRNAMAHGDVLHDHENQEIRIPSTGTMYTPENLEKIWGEVYSLVVFLGGMVQGLVSLNALAPDEVDIDSMDDVFLLRSCFEEVSGD